MYTDEGVVGPNASGEYGGRESWVQAARQLTDSVDKSNEFQNAVLTLSTDQATHHNSSFALKRFVTRIAGIYLNQAVTNEDEVQEIVEVFVNEAKSRPVRCGAVVSLGGVVVKPSAIAINLGQLNLRLRPTVAQDLEVETPIFQFGQPLWETPDSVLHLEALGLPGNQIQEKVQQAVTILRLYKVGSVIAYSYKMWSESFVESTAHGTISTLQRQLSAEKYLVSNEDIERLQRFCRLMFNNIPHHLYGFGSTTVDHIGIAYNRYCDALMHNGALERRIANAVMGLESLFLKGGEIQELTFRLGIRMAKLFGILGDDPHHVRDVIRDGYRVRSLFVHGGHLSYTGKKKLERSYKDTHSFLLEILGYLRKSILMWILAKRSKEELLDLTDDSLVDNVADEKMRGWLTLATEHHWSGVKLGSEV